MNCALLIRPTIRKRSMKDDVNEKVLPADLAAAFTCYHDNLLEQRKLEQKLQIIDLETKQMQRNFRKQRGILEGELKNNENNYWSCHRVFSAESLITDSDSYRKRFYTGPRPTKAKLPRRTLERLSQLLRSLRAEDDLATLLRFQQCARYASRREAPVHKSVSSLTPLRSQGSGSEFDSWELLHATELPSGSSTDSVGTLSNTPGREKRVFSAPVRSAAGKRGLRERDKKRGSLPQQYLSKKLDETSKYSTSKAQEGSRIRFSGDKEEASVKFAWVEKEKLDATVDDVIRGSQSRTDLEQSRDFDLKQTSPQSNSDQSRDTQDSRSIGKDSASSQEQLRRESPCFKDLQIQENEVAEVDIYNQAFSITCEEKAYVESSAAEEKRREENSDRIGSENNKGLTTPSEGWALIKRIYLDNQESLAPNSRTVFENEDLTQVSDKGKGRGFGLTETDDESSSSRKKHAELQGDDNEIRRQPQRRKEEKNTEVTVKSRRGSTSSDNEGSKTKKLHRGADHPAQRRGSRKISITLPKSSLHGLSSHRKSLTPRPQLKPLQKNAQVSKGATDGKEVKNISSKRLPNAEMLTGDFTKMPHDEKQPKDVRKKRKVSVFKRTCLSEALFAGRAQVESQLKKRVQGFLGTVDDVDEMGEKGTGEEELQ